MPIATNFANSMVVIGFASAAAIWGDNAMIATGIKAPYAEVKPQMLTVDALSILSNGQVLFDRTVYSSGRAKWVATVENAEGALICGGVGNSFYGPDESNVKSFGSLKEFVGPDCPVSVKAGSIVSVVWIPVRDDFGPTESYAVVADAPR